MNSYTVDALILSKIKIGEADLLITVFSKQKGKLKLIAKGARKTTSRKRGALKTFSLARLQIVKTKGLHLITEAQIIETYWDWQNDLARVTLAYYMVEIVDKLTREEERHDEVFNYLLSAFELLSGDQKLKIQKDDFAKDVLSTLGFWDKSPLPTDTERLIESIIERKLLTPRIAKKMLS